MLSSSPTRILIVEDDPILARTISNGLREQGYEVELAVSGPQAVNRGVEQAHNIVLLDLTLSDESALGVLRCLREGNENANIIMLTPIDFRQERIAGLEAGADDFIVKPFSMSELVARVEAALVRARSRPKSILEIGQISMDLTTRKVTRSGRPVQLTPTEFRILEILMRNQGKVVTRKMLCEFLWNPEWEGVTNVIEVHINRLRGKINNGREPQMIFTVRGSGYTLRWDPDAAPPRQDYFASAEPHI
ncbi:MAG: response regulator transcription factor [Planctomycetales bacterium]|nr:response regulator transcription factor [Planctomycetales bacterium]